MFGRKKSELPAGLDKALRTAGRLKGPLAVAAAASAASAAAFTLFGQGKPKFLSRRAAQIDSTSPFAETPLPTRAPPTNIWSFSWAVIERLGHDNMTLVAAGVAFYGLLAIFPAIVTFVSIYGLFLNPTTVAVQARAITDILPEQAAALIIGAIENLAARSSADLNLTAVVSLLIALWSARSGVGALMTGVNIANDTPETRGLAHLQALAIALTLVALVGIALVMTLIAAAPVVLHVLPTSIWADSWILSARWPVLAGAAYVAISLLYKVGPARTLHNWRFFNPGALAATTLWIFGTAAFSFYAARIGNFDATYGSIGAVVVLLLWFWLSALFVLLGAEIEAELAEMQPTTGGT
ncbi:MAG: YihY/virulence factor BrkB family protein [Rhizobiales bacterium]|nr:YihY/virulence factor BrkB family protein [Hyphomicrobiales bacterium]